MTDTATPPPVNDLHIREIIRWPEVHRRTGRSRTQVWRDVRAGKFPAPIQIGPNAIGWYSDEIEDHLASLPRCKYAPTKFGEQ